mgnify:CR=1 FL=1
MLELKNISYFYKSQKDKMVLDQISYQFEKGKMYAILGASGSGKTTLLSLLAGLDSPISGEIDMNGENIEEKGKITNMISRSIDYISQCYMEDIRIGDLAKACHISETHFRRVFTSYMHMSPLEYINKVRIQTACEILKKTDESIADIAYKCGFTTNSTFNRNFRQLMGMSPAEWRKRPENYEQQLLKFDIHSEEGW